MVVNVTMFLSFLFRRAMAKLFQMDAMETELRRLNAENRSLQDRGGSVETRWSGDTCFFSHSNFRNQGKS